MRGMKRNNIEGCRNLRKHQTDAEKKLWAILRNRQLAGVKFRRQFSMSKYILDFYSSEYRIGIEVDGGQHYEDKGRERDEIRTRELSKKTNPLASVLSPKGEEVIRNKNCPPSP